MRVLIHSTSGTGTSLLAHTLRMCGADYGRNTIGWKPEMYHHLERSDIEQAMEDKDESYIREVIDSYPNYSVIKITHFREDTWDFLSPIIHDCMMDDVKLMTVRHPVEIHLRNKRVENDGINRKSYNERDPLKAITLQARILFHHGFRSVIYPDAWDTGYIRRVVNKLGFIWNQEVYDGEDNENPLHAIRTSKYDRNKPSRSTCKQKVEYEKRFPHICEVYRNTIIGGIL